MNIERKLSVHPNFSLNSSFEGAELCHLAEPRMYRALQKEMVVAVNGRLVIKFLGKPIALCVRSFETSMGEEFTSGKWYAPLGEELRQNLAEVYDLGVPQVAVYEGEWALMRSAIDADLTNYTCARLGELQAELAVPVGYLSRRAARAVLQEHL